MSHSKVWCAICCYSLAVALCFIASSALRMIPVAPLSLAPSDFRSKSCQRGGGLVHSFGRVDTNSPWACSASASSKRRSRSCVGSTLFAKGKGGSSEGGAPRSSPKGFGKPPAPASAPESAVPGPAAQGGSSDAGENIEGKGIAMMGANSTPAAPDEQLQNAKLTLAFTCKLCKSRSVYKISRIAYNEGMVIAICRGCQAKHLIADNNDKMDFKGFTSNIEEFLKLKGEGVQRIKVTEEGLKHKTAEYLAGGGRKVWDSVSGDAPHAVLSTPMEEGEALAEVVTAEEDYQE